MKISGLILLIYAAATSCAKTSMEHTTTTAQTINDAPAPDTASYLALGDSYTIGEAVPAEASFPYQLVNLLKVNGYPKALSPVIIARTGWTTDELITAIKAGHITRTFDYVTLLIGVNNQYRGYNVNTYRTEFTQLLNTAINYTGGNAKRVFVVSIPDWGVTPYAEGADRAAIAAQINEYNAINNQEAVKAGVNYAGITDISRQAANDLSLVAADGLHPSGKMYTLWAQRLAGPVSASLK